MVINGSTVTNHRSGTKTNNFGFPMRLSCSTIETPASISDEIGAAEVVGKVERGYTLIKSMRERLDETKGKIEKLRAQFE
jgi:hypothetical protein